MFQPSCLEGLERRKEVGKAALSAVGGSEEELAAGPAGRSLSLGPEKLLVPLWELWELWELWGVPAGLSQSWTRSPAWGG